ncbi:MAG: hypothetical protein WHV63_07390 [Ignavibacteria bacterium]|nr:hypothetical protein [Ignavibacteria bacterium]
MSGKINFLIFFITFISHLTFAQELEIGGYSKYLFSLSKFKGIDENLIDHTIHSRLNLKYYFNDEFTVSAGVRDKILIGKSIEKYPAMVDGFTRKEYYFDLDDYLWKKKNSINFIEVDRFWLDWNLKNFQISLGRQRIAWGTSWVWNITDIFNPLSILDFDYEERPAVDALRFQFFPSTTSKVDMAAKLSEEKNNSSIALQLFLNKYEYDFYVMFGYHLQRYFAGFSWSGDISGAGFRGEIFLTDSPDKMKFDFPNSFSDEKKKQLSFVLSLDYTFENSFYIHSELLYNNIGKTKSIGIYALDALKIGLLSPSKLNLFYQAGYNLSALSRIDLIALHNPYDQSFVLLPTFSYSLLENLDLSVVSLYFNGRDFAEYSPTGFMFFSRLKYSF